MSLLADCQRIERHGAVSRWVVKRIRVFVHDRKEKISVGKVAILGVEGKTLFHLGLSVLYFTGHGPTLRLQCALRRGIAHSVRAQAK